MLVDVDAVGNLRGVYPGKRPNAARLLIGSHLDTVPNAGAYDGVLGVVVGIALVEAMAGQRLSFDMEVIGFSEEEGIRFGFPFIGSRGFLGSLREEELQTLDKAGVSVEQAISNFGLDGARLSGACVSGKQALAYLEFHIEQGPVLESLDLPLGVVDAIAGQSRATLIFRGKANHAGTTPMHLRRDALAGAAEWITEVEQEARSTEGLVATVGNLQVRPGAGNVIAGEVNATLDVRHASDDVRLAAVERITAKAKWIAERRGLVAEYEVRLDQLAVAMDAPLVSLAESALAKCSVKPHRMTSGAGHDAMIISEKIPSVMVFLRSPGGISHHPDETVRVEDVEAALRVGSQFIREMEDFRV